MDQREQKRRTGETVCRDGGKKRPCGGSSVLHVLSSQATGAPMCIPRRLTHLCAQQPSTAGSTDPFTGTRYVALNTLNKVVAIDTNAVQRHRNIILDCLRDGDISIRRRALELSYALINEQNVRILTRELLAFLEVADDEFKLGMTTQICLAAERFAPNKRWHIDTVLRVLKLVCFKPPSAVA